MKKNHVLKWMRLEGGEIVSWVEKRPVTPLLKRLRYFLICLLAGKDVVALNANIRGIEVPPNATGALIQGNQLIA